MKSNNLGNSLLRRVWVSVHVDQECRGHEVWRLLCLLIQYVVVGVPDERPVVRVKELVLRTRLVAVIGAEAKVAQETM